MLSKPTQKEAASKTIYVCYRCGTEHSEEERKDRFCKNCKASLSFSKQKKILEFKEISETSPLAKNGQQTQVPAVGEEIRHEMVLEWLSSVGRNESSGQKLAVVGALISSRLVQELDDANAVKQSKVLLDLFAKAKAGVYSDGTETDNPLVETLKRQVLDYSHQIDRLATFAVSKFGTTEELESQVDALPWMGGDATKLAVKWITSVVLASN